MKICLDLQVCQSKEFRGIGRYSLDFAKAVVNEAHARCDEVDVLLSGNFRERIAQIQNELDLDQDAYRFVHTTQLSLNEQAKESLDTLFLNRISDAGKYDVVHDAHAFEYPEGFSLNFDPGQSSSLHSATFYDLIPLKMPDRYLVDPGCRVKYLRQVESLKKRDLLLAISEATRRDGLDLLGLPSDRIVTISTGVDEGLFNPGTVLDERRAQLCAQYGIQRPFLLYTTGLDPRKNLLRLVQAFATLPSRLKNAYQLVVVCPRNAWSVGIIADICRTAGVQEGHEVVFTGFVPDDDLVDLYRMARLFVFPSLYEGFGLPIVEAIRCGTPAIGSDCSSIVELLPAAETRFNPKATASIAGCITNALDREFSLEAMWEEELRHVTRYTWSNVAKTALDAWHELVCRTRRRTTACPKSFYSKVADVIRRQGLSDIGKIAHLCLVNDKCRAQKARVLFDISFWINADFTTGIQRVVSKVAAAFRKRNDGRDYQAVALRNGKLYNCRYNESSGKYEYADAWKCQERDILVMLDSSWEWRDSFLPVFNEIHAFGGVVYSVVYDILPVLQPDLFGIGIRTVFPCWLKHAFQNTDGLVCISKSVGLECREYALTHRDVLPLVKQMPIGHFYLGADFAAQNAVAHKATEFPFADDMRIVISVGTIEPRKNHAYMLEVMERVLARAKDVCWVIVGQKGWMMDDWTAALQENPLFGKRIFHYPKADDSQLSALYDRAEFLLNLSEGEGYGLPLIEAAEKGKRVICSDIPVFHEIDRFGFVYCPLDDSEMSASRVLDALNGIGRAQARVSSAPSRFSWDDAAQMLVDCVVGNRWDLVVSIDKPIPREKEIRIVGKGLQLQEYLFSEFCDAAYVLGTGFSTREPWGVWCCGKKFEMTVKLPETQGRLELVVKAQRFGDACKEVRVLDGKDELAVLGALAHGDALEAGRREHPRPKLARTVLVHATVEDVEAEFGRLARVAREADLHLAPGEERALHRKPSPGDVGVDLYRLHPGLLPEVVDEEIRKLVLRQVGGERDAKLRKLLLHAVKPKLVDVALAEFLALRVLLGQHFLLGLLDEVGLVLVRPHRRLEARIVGCVKEVRRDPRVDPVLRVVDDLASLHDAVPGDLHVVQCNDLHSW